MKFAVMVQSPGPLPENYDAVRDADGVTLFHLTFKTELPGALFLPKSTWTEGRNRLFEAARASQAAFDYYIFADDDVSFAKGGWRQFLSDLEQYRPAIGAPAFYEPNAGAEPYAAYDFDAIVTAFHRDVITDGLVLPYIADFDAESWWLSQYFVIHLANAFYPRGVVKLPATAITNEHHGEYPRIDAARFHDFDAVYFDLWEDVAFARRSFRTHFLTREDPPFPPRLAVDYRLPEAVRRRLKPRRAQPT